MVTYQFNPFTGDFDMVSEEDLSSYVPYTGATSDVNIGSHDFYVGDIDSSGNVIADGHGKFEKGFVINNSGDSTSDSDFTVKTDTEDKAFFVDASGETAEFNVKLRAGDIDSGDYAEIRNDGTHRAVGDATAWSDMIGDLFGKKLYSNVGKVDYDYDNNAMKFQKNGSITTKADRVGTNLEINHQFAVGNSIAFKPHIHWFQDVSDGTVIPFVLTMRWRLQRNGYAKNTSWTTITCTAGTDDIFDFTGEADGTYNQLSRFDDVTVDCSVSDTFQYQIARTDSEDGDMYVYFMDLHGRVDSFGSDEEIAKVN